MAKKVRYFYQDLYFYKAHNWRFQIIELFINHMHD